MTDFKNVEFSERVDSILFGVDKEILSNVGIRFKKDEIIYYEDKSFESTDDPSKIKQDFSPNIYFKFDLENFKTSSGVEVNESILSVAIDDIVLRDRKEIATWDLNKVPSEYKINLNEKVFKLAGSGGFNIIISIHRKKNMAPARDGWHKSHNISRKIFSIKVTQDTSLYDIKWTQFKGDKENGLFYVDFESQEVSTKSPLDCINVYFNLDIRTNFYNLDRSKNGRLVVHALSQQILSDIFFLTLKYADTKGEPETDSLQDLISKKFKDEKEDFNSFAKILQDEDDFTDHEIKIKCNIISQRLIEINEEFLKFQPL